jgi:hypothetical protein
MRAYPALGFDPAPGATERVGGLAADLAAVASELDAARQALLKSAAAAVPGRAMPRKPSPGSRIARGLRWLSSALRRTAGRTGRTSASSHWRCSTPSPGTIASGLLGSSAVSGHQAAPLAQRVSSRARQRGRSPARVASGAAGNGGGIPGHALAADHGRQDQSRQDRGQRRPVRYGQRWRGRRRTAAPAPAEAPSANDQLTRDERMPPD